jgi:seryl-tRNA(Sec) selenium transferase
MFLCFVGWGRDEALEETSQVSPITRTSAWIADKPQLALTLHALKLDLQLEHNEQRRYTSRFSKAFRARSRNRKHL